MTEKEIEKFIEQYDFLYNRCEEYVQQRHSDSWYDGFDVDNGYIRAKFSKYSYGENLDDYDYMSEEDLDESTNLEEKYRAEREDIEWKKMLREEERENREKRNAQYEIERLKQKYGI